MKRLFGRGRSEAKGTPERPAEEPAAAQARRDVVPTCLKPIVTIAGRYGIDHFATPEGKSHALSEMLTFMTDASALLYVMLVLWRHSLSRSYAIQ